MRLVTFTAEASLIESNNHYFQSIQSYHPGETIIPAAPRWGPVSREHCRTLSTRQYSSILWDIPWGSSWERACRETPITINGQEYRAARCVNNGFNIWGQFDVQDSSCDTSSHSYNGPCGTTQPGGRSCVSGFDPYSGRTLTRCCLPGPRWAWIKVYRNRPHEEGCGFPCIL
jgi:hypothetical protein